ncbi:MAG: hypothetical protein ABSH28_12955 [Acidobacteriota bacterium]
MPPKMNIEELFRQYLSKEDADALLAKVDTMVNKKKSAAEIESVIMVDISRQIEKQIVKTIRRKASEIDVDINASIRPVAVFHHIDTGIRNKISVQVKR